MRVSLLNNLTWRISREIENRYIKTYKPFFAPLSNKVYVDRIEKDSRYPWILNIEGTVQLDDGGYEWDTQFDVTTEKWSPVRYLFGGHIYFMEE